MKRISLMFFIVISVFSCKKEVQDNREYLSSRKWHLVSIFITPARLAPDSVTYYNEEFPYIDECHKDDYIVFNEDGYLYRNSSEISCNPGIVTDKYFKSGKWIWSYDKKGLSIQEFLYSSYPNQYQIGLHAWDLVGLSSNVLTVNEFYWQNSTQYCAKQTYLAVE